MGIINLTMTLLNGQKYHSVLDFLVRLKTKAASYLILETKGYDTLAEVKRAVAERWVAAVNADGCYGKWRYAVAKKVSDISGLLS